MTPSEFIKSLFEAIEKKDLPSIKKFLPHEGPLAVILNDGSVIEDVEDFLDFFEEWFHEDEWSMKHSQLLLEETAEMAFAVLVGDYASKDEDGNDFNVEVFTTCIIRKIDGEWKLVHFQQTEGEDEE